MPSERGLPFFHLYGDPPDDQAFDFIHVETISSRSSIHDWTIHAHRHRNLFQILVIERGGGDMTFEAAAIAFTAPCTILLPATVAHGFRFTPHETEGWVVSFTEDVTHGLGERSGDALGRLRALARRAGDSARRRHGDQATVVALRRFVRGAMSRARRLSSGDARLSGAAGDRGGAAGASRARTGVVTLRPADPTVDALRRLVEKNFRKERQSTTTPKGWR